MSYMSKQTNQCAFGVQSCDFINIMILKDKDDQKDMTC